jgi:hypothetical protein
MIKHPDNIWANGGDLQGNSIISETPATAVIKARKADTTATTLFTYAEATDAITAKKDIITRRDPRWYGALGNGSTDDTTAMNAVLAAQLVVDIPPGYTFLTGPLTLTREGQIIKSVGATRPYTGNPISAGCIKLIAGGNGDLIYVNNVSGVQLLGLHLDGNKANNTAGRAVHFYFNAFGKILDCYAHDSFGDLISLDLSDECEVSGYLYNAGGHGLIGNSGDHIIHVIAEKCGGAGIYCINGYSWQVTGHSLSNGTWGFVAQGTGGSFVQRMNVNLQARNNGQQGLYFLSARSCTVAGFAQANSQSSVGGYAAVRVEDCDKITFINMHANDVGVAAGVGTSGIPSQKYGIEMAGTSTNVSVVGGHLAGLTAPFLGLNINKLRGVIGVADSGGAAALTYSASITPDSATERQTITATTAVAFAVNAPPTPVSGQRLTVAIRNTSGGALGAATWNAVFKMTAWTQPANGFSRSITFEYDGTNWVESTRAAADVPN